MPRVVVVDDDDVSRRGLAELLADQAEIDVVASLTHGQARAWKDWSRVDVAVVDAADERERGDQFPGVGVVALIREQRRGDETTVMVLTGHFFDDAVRRRMREAGADFLYHRSDLADARRLCDAVLRPEAAHRGVPDPMDPQQAFQLGVRDRTQVNAGVNFLTEHGPPTVDGQPVGRRSRAWLRWRREFNQQARLHPVNTDGRPPGRVQELPSVSQISRFWEWATKIKGRPRSTGPD